MKPDERQALRDAAERALKGAHARVTDRHAEFPLEWQLQTSNSFRRIGTTYGDGHVLCGTKHPIDGHPDLTGATGVLDYIIAAQPSVVLALLDELERCEDTLTLSRKHHERDHAALPNEPTRLTAEEHALVVEVCRDLINHATAQEEANAGAGNKWSVAARQKEATLRKLLGGAR